MKANKIFGAVLMMVLVSACAGEGGGKKGNASRDSDGYCTSEFVSAYNRVVSESKLLKLYMDSHYTTQAEIQRQTQVLKNACDTLFPKHDNVTCKAEVDYRETDVTSNNLVQICAMATQGSN